MPIEVTNRIAKDDRERPMDARERPIDIKIN